MDKVLLDERRFGSGLYETTRTEVEPKSRTSRLLRFSEYNPLKNKTDM